MALVSQILYYVTLVHQQLHEWSVSLSYWLQVPIKQYWLYLPILMLIPVAIAIVSKVAFRLLRIIAPYPHTPMGFRGQLIYADQKGEPTFVSRSYRLSARPDFIYRLQDGTYMLIELKSAKHYHPSYAVQALIGVIVARTRYKVTKAAVMTGDKQLHDVPMASKSSGAIYRHLRKHIQLSRKLINSKKRLPPPAFEDKCKTCFQKDNCHPKHY